MKNHTALLAILMGSLSSMAALADESGLVCDSPTIIETRVDGAVAIRAAGGFSRSKPNEFVGQKLAILSTQVVGHVRNAPKEESPVTVVSITELGTDGDYAVKVKIDRSSNSTALKKTFWMVCRSRVRTGNI